MIITRTPFRISFAGGGSDLRAFYREEQGCVLSTSIDKYMYLSLHPYFFEKGYLLKYSKHEQVDALRDIQHPIIRTIFEEYGIQGVDFNSSADIPSGTGLGSSSAFAVGLTHLCNAYTDRYASKEAMAAYACDLEIEKLKEPIGKQDQYACAMGGLNLITFNPDESVDVEKICLRPENVARLNDNLVMLYTGKTRSARSILSAQQKATETDSQKRQILRQMSSLAKTLRHELLSGNIDAMGALLHEGWELKKTMVGSISDPDIDAYYEQALHAGATGGKLLGAGGGGFLLFYVPKELQEGFRSAMTSLKELKVRLEYSGTSIIHYSG